ncbi:WxL domain-containing protein [Enterococcus faecalis]|uniref:WxL domain-containing protein n=1 Tax=Enterococcus faecalis TaxID=1351 RepID=UPI0030C87D16
MKKTHGCLLALSILTLLFFCSTVFAEEKESEATITILESKQEQTIEKTNSPSAGDEEQLSKLEIKRESYLPKTNEKYESIYVTLGDIILLIVLSGVYIKIKRNEEKKMKKMNVLLTVGLTTFGAIALGQVAHADDSKDTQASVVVKEGDLSIKNVDDIAFTDIHLDGKAKDVQEKEGTQAKVTVEDFRGSSSKGWTLKAKLKEGNFNGLGLKLSPSLNSNKESATTVTETNSLNEEEALVASVADEKIKETEFDTEVQLNAKLNVPEKTKANTYKTTIVWNLAATPETTTPGTK